MLLEVYLASDTVVNVESGASLAFNNRLNLGGSNLTMTGNGDLMINNQVVTGGGTLVGMGGTLSGSGSVLGDLSNLSGTVAPGNSPGALTVTGDYVQGGEATLEMELAGVDN